MDLKRMAEEAARALLEVDDDRSRPLNWQLSVCGYYVDLEYAGRRSAEEGVEQLGESLADAFLAFAEHVLRAAPVPGGVSDGRLEEIRRLNDDSERWAHAAATAMIRELFAHIDYLHAILRSPEGAEWGAGYDAGRRATYAEGFAAGAEEQRRIMINAANRTPTPIQTAEQARNEIRSRLQFAVTAKPRKGA